MDPPSRSGSKSGWSAPGKSGGRSGARLPAVDDHIAPPETRVEYLRGMELYAAPAKPPHAIRHNELAYVLRAHAAAGYRTAVDMLTRTSEGSDFAPDASVFAADRDPRTGGRKLEELAFEVSDERRLGVTTTKARELVARGVRRVFVVLVKQRRVLEWSRPTDGWQPLPHDAAIEDRCLVRPMPVAALLDATAGDDAVARALLDKHVPTLDRALAHERGVGAAEGRAEGRAEGTADATIATKQEAVAMLLRTRGLRLSRALEARLRACRDLAQLDAWFTRAVTAETTAQVFGTVRGARRGKSSR